MLYVVIVTLLLSLWFPIDAEIISGTGQLLKWVENRTTGETFDFDNSVSTWYLDAGWSGEFEACYLKYLKKK